MATACESFFGNDDLLLLLALQLPRTSIAALRLTSTALKAHISQYLFRTLRMRFSRWYVKRLCWIAARDTFRKGVRELVFDTATYDARPQEGDFMTSMERELWSYASAALEDAGLGDCSRPEGEQRLDEFKKVYRRAAADENCALSACLANPLDFDAALRALEHCHTLTITPWSGPGKTFFNRASLLGDNVLPPPLADLVCRRHTYAVQNAARCMLLGEAHAPRQQFSVVNIRSVAPKLQPTFSHDYYHPKFPGIALAWHKPNPFLAQTIQRPVGSSALTRLRLELQVETLAYVGLAAVVAATTPRSFAGLWTLAPNLQHLDLEMRVTPRMPEHVREDDGRYELATKSTFLGPAFRPSFPKLTTLVLRSMWLELDDLEGFITAHRSSLNHISLLDITLGDTEDQQTPHPQGTWLYLRPLFPNRMHGSGATNRSYLGDSLVLPVSTLSWERVMRACRDVRFLKGLVLRGLSTSPEWNVFSELDVLELIDLGMGGRRNELEIPGLGTLWD